MYKIFETLCISPSREINLSTSLTNPLVVLFPSLFLCFLFCLLSFSVPVSFSHSVTVIYLKEENLDLLNTSEVLAALWNGVENPICCMQYHCTCVYRLLCCLYAPSIYSSSKAARYPANRTTTVAYTHCSCSFYHPNLRGLVTDLFRSVALMLDVAYFTSYLTRATFWELLETMQIRTVFRVDMSCV